MSIQSVLFNRKKWDILKSVEWLQKNKLVHSKVDITTNYLRYRQFTPKKGDKYITKNLGKGIKIIIKI